MIQNGRLLTKLVNLKLSHQNIDLTVNKTRAA